MADNNIKKKKRIRIGPISQSILSVVAVGGTVSLLAVTPGAAMVAASFLKKKTYHPKQAIERNIDSLIKSGLLKRTKTKDGVTSVRLSLKGKWEAGIRGYFNSSRKKHVKWDHIWHIVAFDISENKRKIRDEVRRAVKLYGFIKLQNSVWVYPYACEDFVHIVKQHLGASADVLYIKAKYIENDSQLKKEFNV